MTGSDIFIMIPVTEVAESVFSDAVHIEMDKYIKTLMETADYECGRKLHLQYSAGI